MPLPQNSRFHFLCRGIPPAAKMSSASSHDPRPVTWLIRSANRTSGTATDFRMKLEAPLRIESGGWFRVGAVTIPMSMHSIRAGYNSAIDVGGANAGTVNLAPGAYTAGTLAAEVEAQLQTLDAGFSCSWSGTALAFTIAHSSTAFTLDWASGANAGANAGYALGFAPADTASGTSASSDSAATLGEPLAFLVASSKLSSVGPQGLVSKTRGSRLIQRVPNSAPAGDLLHWTAVRSSTDQLPFQVPDGGLQLGELDFEIYAYGDWGSYTVDLRGDEWQIELEVAGLE